MPQVEKQQRKIPETSSLISESHVYGRDDRKKYFIRQFLEDKPSYENYVVIPVVGMGGIGKTTLAQYVYNDEKVKAHFDLKAWVCVSDECDVKRITKDIINLVTQDSFDCSTLEKANKKLEEVVEDKKFFVVLDVWSEDYEKWDKLQRPFHVAARGSRVIVTTRIKTTSFVMNGNFINVEGLSGS